MSAVYLAPNGIVVKAYPESVYESTIGYDILKKDILSRPSTKESESELYHVLYHKILKKVMIVSVVLYR